MRFHQEGEVITVNARGIRGERDRWRLREIMELAMNKFLLSRRDVVPIMNRRMDGRRSRMENCYSPLSMNLSRYLVLQIRSGKYRTNGLNGMVITRTWSNLRSLSLYARIICHQTTYLLSLSVKSVSSRGRKKEINQRIIKEMEAAGAKDRFFLSRSSFLLSERKGSRRVQTHPRSGMINNPGPSRISPRAPDGAG